MAARSSEWWAESLSLTNWSPVNTDLLHAYLLRSRFGMVMGSPVSTAQMLFLRFWTQSCLSCQRCHEVSCLTFSHKGVWWHVVRLPVAVPCQWNVWNLTWLHHKPQSVRIWTTTLRPLNVFCGRWQQQMDRLIILPLPLAYMLGILMCVAAGLVSKPKCIKGVAIPRIQE